MKATTVIVTGLLLAVLIGCGSPVRYRFDAYRAVGTAIPVELTVRHKPDQSVTGTVHHRVKGQGQYKSTRMTLRGNQLWAMLPTDHLSPQDTVEYYLDVSIDGELHAVASPGSPFVVTLLDETELVFSRLHDRVVASNDQRPVHFVLHANGQPIDQPTVVYRMPGVPGDIRAPMEPGNDGDYFVEIPPYSVHAGTWQYAIEVEYNGHPYRLPRQGYQSFVVKHLSYREAHAETHK